MDSNMFLKDCLCRQCNGTGEIPFKYGETKCPLCHGVGQEPTQMGKDLMLFLKKVYGGRL